MKSLSSAIIQSELSTFWWLYRLFHIIIKMDAAHKGELGRAENRDRSQAKKDFVKSTVTRLMRGGNRYQKNKDRINAKRRVKYAAKKAPSPH
jgi:hypothetical protein